MLRSLILSLGVPAALAAQASPRATPTSAPAAAPSPAATPLSAPPASPRPTLVVFLTVDQLTEDYFTRFAPQLTGGLRRLWSGGAVFTNAHHDQGTTETAPGHAATMSGRFPMHTGIVRNNAGVQDEQAPLVGASGPGASPFRFRGSALVDWMRSADPRTRALSVSRKDRGAILPLGRAKQSVFWWSPDGRFTTSRYYADTLPTWVQRFNARDPLAAYRGRAWTPLLADSAYAEPDSVPYESSGKDYTFPHRLAAEPEKAAREFAEFPWMDEVTLSLALDGLQALQLGTGEQTDLLAVSLSTTDAVGHRYGPDSREAHDQILRLDRALGVFLDSLYRLRDSSRVIVALTADHGMTSLPQVHFPGTDPRRGRADVKRVLDATKARLAARGLDSATALDFESGMVLVDRAELARGGVREDSLVRSLAAELQRVPGVQRVYRRAELAPLAAKGDKYARRWLHATPADLPGVAFVTLKPYYYWSTVNYATHGSPHDTDTHVPVIFYGAPFRAGKYAQFARVVDMAPTLAAVLGVPPTEPLDGVVLTAALRAAPTAARQAAR